jgi:L-asparagine permease
MAFNSPVGTITIGGLVVLIPALIGGWYLVRDRVAEIGALRTGDSGELPRPTEAGGGL